MLSDAKIVLEQRLYKILYNAYLTQFNQNSVVELGSFNSTIQDAFNKVAHDFASTASKPTADAIYKFIKEIGININIPPTVISPSTPVLPGGPCSGVILPQNIIIS